MDFIARGALERVKSGHAKAEVAEGWLAGNIFWEPEGVHAAGQL